MFTKDLLKVSVLVVLIASVLIFIVWSQEPAESVDTASTIQNLKEAKDEFVPRVKGVLKEIKSSVSPKDVSPSMAGDRAKTEPSGTVKENKATPSERPSYQKKRVIDERYRFVKVDEKSKAVGSAAPTIGFNHIVSANDSLWTISRKYYGKGSMYKRILTANPGMKKDSVLRLGQKIIIPEVEKSKGNESKSGPALAGKYKKTDMTERSTKKTGLSNGRHYVVQMGDNLEKISLRNYGTRKNWSLIAKANNIKDPRSLRIKQMLILPELPKSMAAKGNRTTNQSHQIANNRIAERSASSLASAGYRIHKVGQGDTLCRISKKYFNTTQKVQNIMQENRIQDKDTIYIGQTLKIPSA